jgi:outer membrane protein assembly factor BamB
MSPKDRWIPSSKRKPNSQLIPVFIFPLILVACLLAGDWPRFRGPNGSGIAETTAVPHQFGPDKNMVWRTVLPLGHSSPVLTGNSIFLTGADGQKLFTFCLSRETGQILWRRECPRDRSESLDKRNTAASPSAVTDGKSVYVFFGDFGLVSYGFDGNERWRVPLGPFHNVYGMGVSPIVAGDNIILVCDQSRDSFVIAVGKNDGRVRWKRRRPEALSGHSTPVIYQPEGGPSQIIAPGSFRVDAYSVETGETLWWANGLPSEMKSGVVLGDRTMYISGFNSPENDPGRQIHVPPFDELLAAHDKDKDGRISLAEVPDERTKMYFPFIDLDQDGFIAADEWKIYAATMAAENALLAIRPGGHGDITSSSLLWKYQRAVPQLPTLLLYQNVIYMLSDAGVLTTLNPSTGAMLKQGRLRGVADHYYASPVAADDKIFIASQAGVVTVLKAGAEQEFLAANELDDECYATPAIADGRLYIRTRSTLYCFGKK